MTPLQRAIRNRASARKAYCLAKRTERNFRKAEACADDEVIYQTYITEATWMAWTSAVELVRQAQKKSLK